MFLRWVCRSCCISPEMSATMRIRPRWSDGVRSLRNARPARTPLTLGKGDRLHGCGDPVVRTEHFSFEFSALSFRSPATNRYRYMLEGLDANWHVVGSDRRLASYTTLPAGVYTLRVQGSTSRGPWSEPGAALRIKIVPPWWGTLWFKTLVAVLVFCRCWVSITTA